MKLAIIGSRTFNNYTLLCAVVRTYFKDLSIQEVISGGAAGADSLGARYAKDNNLQLREFIPDWEKYGKSAGFIRNEDIVKNADFVLCFWDGVSRGTQNSLGHAKKMKKPTLIIYF